jgi:tRNA (cmo5U34)-methyltransferase
VANVATVTDIEWDPSRYLDVMLAEIPSYLELQAQAAGATADLHVDDALELGVGTGETARRVLALHPRARWVGIDNSEAMLGHARKALPDSDLRKSRLEDPLPDGPFDLVISVLAIHHLESYGKRDLFERVHAVLRPQGTFVVGDLVVPERPEDVRTEIDGIVDRPDTLRHQLEWLREAGFDAEERWIEKDLAVFRATS